MEFISHYGLFLLEALTIVAAILIVVAGLVAILAKDKVTTGNLKVEDISAKFIELKDNLTEQLLTKKELKIYKKQQKIEQKKQKDLPNESKNRLFILKFKAGIEAKEVASLREEITAILTIANKDDKVMVNLESGGGMVHSYGLAASQLLRLKDAGIDLNICIDKVAASGGYMMACTANKIYAAPFAIVGSIGVIAQIPNFNKVLKHYNIDYEQHTAGEFKRTLTLFGENTDAARTKFLEELNETHILFKDHIKNCRPTLDLDKVATGEHWYGTQALDLGLIDELTTSDDYIMQHAKDYKIIKLNYHVKKGLASKLAGGANIIIKSMAETFASFNNKI